MEDTDMSGAALDYWHIRRRIRAAPRTPAFRPLPARPGHLGMHRRFIRRLALLRSS